MIDMPDGYLDRNTDYKLHPCMFNLRPDAMFMCKLGISTSPEGWWDCVTYGHEKGSYKEWLELAWTVKSEGERKISFWVKGLSKVSDKWGDRPTFPEPPRLDGFWLEIVDWNGPKSMGYGKEWKQGWADDIDGVFKWIVDQPVLRNFFFTEQEIGHMALDHYDKDLSDHDKAAADYRLNNKLT